MPADVIIDLLSSDDESPRGHTATNGRGGPKSAFQQADLPSIEQSKENTVTIDQDWTFSPQKRRRISPTDDSVPVPLSKTNHVKAVVGIKTAPSRFAKSINLEAVDQDDPIIFTSSIQEPDQPADPLDDENDASDGSLPDDLLKAISSNVQAPSLSSRTEALLKSMSRSSKNPRSQMSRTNSGISGKRVARSTSRETDGGGIGRSERHVAQQARKGAKMTAEEREAREREKQRAKEARANEREQAKLERAQNKEEDKERKRIEREEKVKEKRKADQLAEANKIKLDRKDSTPEMIVDLPISLAESELDVKTRAMLKNAGADTTIYQSSIPNIIKWRRKSKRKWNTELRHWEPLENMVIEDESHVLCFMQVKDLAPLVLGAGAEETLETHVTKLRSAHEGGKLIYLVEGYQALINQSKAADRRAFQNQVLAQDPATANQQSKRKRADASQPIDIAAIEAALLRLQVISGCLIHHTSKPQDSAEWIVQFTQHISTIPYRHHLFDLSRPFCMESGQVRTGDDKDDTYIRMLQEVVRVTPSIAQGIFEAYPSVVDLVQAFRKDGNMVLKDLYKRANRSGASTGARIGPAISRRLYKIFMATDPESTEV